MHLHHVLTNRTELVGELALTTAMHVGSSQTGPATDAPVIRNAFGAPFIPGSSLKGALRSRAESLAHALDFRVCHLTRLSKEQEQNVSADQVDCISRHSRGANAIHSAIQDYANDEVGLAAFINERLCDGCQLFGGSSWKARVDFNDLEAIAEEGAPTELRDGVGIDRDTRKAANNVKYDFEVVPAGFRFRFHMTAENMDERNWALLAAGLLELIHGHVPLGGKTTRGLGGCRLESASLKLTHVDFTHRDHALAFLIGEPPIQKHPEGWLAEKIRKRLQMDEAEG